MEQQQQLNIEDGSKTQRAEWVLNSPEPPGLCHEIVSSIKSAVFPNGGKHSSSSTKQTRSTAAGVVSFLHGLFPILTWGRNYKATKFRNDLMAGLTLASLSIPQVHTWFLSVFFLYEFVEHLTHILLMNLLGRASDMQLWRTSHLSMVYVSRWIHFS